jgi:hypothetical protein
MATIIPACNVTTGSPDTDTSGYHHGIILASLAAARAALAARPGAALSIVLADIRAVRAIELADGLVAARKIVQRGSAAPLDRARRASVELDRSC